MQTVVSVFGRLGMLFPWKKSVLREVGVCMVTEEAFVALAYVVNWRGSTWLATRQQRANFMSKFMCHLWQGQKMWLGDALAQRRPLVSSSCTAFRS